MPRLACTFERFREILEVHGFELHRHEGTNHRRYRGEHSGRVWMVDMSPPRWHSEIKPGTLKAMIQQSGLPKSLFRH